MPSVKHSGNIGDILYALPALKHLYDTTGQQIMVYLNPVDFRMSLTLVEVIKPLLNHQKYIAGVAIYEKEDVDFDLDFFRKYGPEYGWHLGYMHCALLGLDPIIAHNECIFLDETINYDLPKVDIVVNRTERYTNDAFPWESVLNEQYASSTKGFVGLPHEFDLFTSKYNIKNIQHIPTTDYLQLAWLIKQSKLFIGNCSSPYALAEGMKHSTIQETCTWIPHGCLYPRDNAYYFLTDFFKAT